MKQNCIMWLTVFKNNLVIFTYLCEDSFPVSMNDAYILKKWTMARYFAFFNASNTQDVCQWV